MSHIETALSSPQPSEPNAAWGLEKLVAFVREAGAESDRLEGEALKLGSKILRLHFERGKALFVIRNQIFEGKKKAWGRFRKENGLVGTTFDDDMRLFESAYSWEEISGMGLTEARVYLGVTKPKVRQGTGPGTGTDQASGSQAKLPDGPPTAQAIARLSTPPDDVSPPEEMAPAANPPTTLPTRVSGSVAPTTGSPAPEETLFKIVRRLEELEREVQGQPAKSLVALIDQAVEVLGRLRGVATPKDLAA